MKKTSIALMLIAGLCLPGVLQARQTQFEVATNPLSLMLGALDVEGQYFFQKDMSAGLFYYQYDVPFAGENFSITVLQPFVGYYLSPGKDGWFARGGYFTMDIELGGGVSGSIKGPTAGGGYNWLWRNGLSVHAGYELILAGTAKVGNTTFSSQTFSLGIFKVGYAF